MASNLELVKLIRKETGEIWVVLSDGCIMDDKRHSEHLDLNFRISGWGFGIDEGWRDIPTWRFLIGCF